MKKLLQRYLWWLGLMLIVAGLVATFISATASPLAILVLSLGSLLTLIGLLISPSVVNFLKQRSTQTGTNALVSTSVFIGLLFLINFMGFRYSFSLDLTENQIYTLSPQTQKIMTSLSQPLKLWLFEDREVIFDTTLLEQYSQYSDQFSFEIVDPNQEIALAQQFNVNNVGDLFLEYGEKKQFLMTLTETTQFSELQLTNGIAKILLDNPFVVYFIQGHGEPPLTVTEGGMSQAVTNLESLGYQVEALTLAKETKIPEDANVIIIAGAKRDFLDSEIQLLRDYLNQGGSLFLMVEVESEANLESLVASWGIEFTDTLIIDPRVEEIVTPIIDRYGEHPITQDFLNGLSIFSVATPISTVATEGIDAIALITTSEETWAENRETLAEQTELIFNPETDIPGPLDLGVAFTRIQSPSTEQTTVENDNEDQATATEEKVNEDNETPIDGEEDEAESDSVTETPSEPDLQESETLIESRLVVIGDSTFATDGLFETQLNGDLFLNTVKWLVNDQENPLSIRPKEPQNRRLNLTPFQSLTLTLLSLVIFPLIGVIISILTWWRRSFQSLNLTASLLFGLPLIALLIGVMISGYLTGVISVPIVIVAVIIYVISWWMRQ